MLPPAQRMPAGVGIWEVKTRVKETMPGANLLALSLWADRRDLGE
jgi:hypothetical protein